MMSNAESGPEERGFRVPHHHAYGSVLPKALSGSEDHPGMLGGPGKG